MTVTFAPPNETVLDRPKPMTNLPTSLPPLAAYPVVPFDEELSRENRIVGFDTRVREARPFTLLRSQVLDRWRTEHCKVIGFTSATPSAGKSFVVSNLALSLALLPDIQVFVFDFDLRRGTLAENLQIESSLGIDHFLSGQSNDLARIGQRIGNYPLVVFPCSPITEHSAPLVANEAFATLIECARRLPDNAIVLCDLPPTFADDDAKLISEKLDGYVLICEDGITTRKQLLTSVEFMQPSKLIGTILNRAQNNFDDRYGYGSKAYSSYYK